MAHRAYDREERRERREGGQREGGGHEEHGCRHAEEGTHEERLAPQPAQQR